MSSGCGDVLSLEDLRIAKQHQLFEAEVITGKQGGVTSGADIDYATNQATGQTQKTLPAILRDVGFRPANFTFVTGGTLGNGDSDVAVLWPVASGGDGNYYVWKGELPKVIPANSTPASSGGVSSSAWMPVGDVTFREEIKTGNGSDIGTSHRGNLQKDLDAIDRRPDGYAGGINAVLANGNDVELSKAISISSPVVIDSGKHVRGAGGTITETSGLAAVLRADGFNAPTKMDISIKDLDAKGSVLSSDDTNESVESYAVFTYNSQNTHVRGVRATGLTGGVYAGKSKNMIISDVNGYGLVYHPNLARGGYTVLTDDSKETIINNITIDVGAGADGRHLLYMSTGGHGVTDGNRNVIANNLIGRYNGKNDRNFPVVVIRKSERFVINNVIGEGANAGIAFNHQNGEITDYILSNLNFDLVKYANGTGIYGVSQGDTPFIGNRWLISNAVIRVRPANGLDSRDCVAVNLTHGNGMLSNLVCSIPNGSSPILIGDTATNIHIDGVLDNILPYDSLTTAPLIAFTGSAANNIKVSGIKTSRPMFARLGVVTDLTVDFQRKARIATNGSGGTTKIDTNEITSTVALTATSMNVAFPSHVTQNAVENVQAVGTGGAYQVFITSIGAKVISLAFYTPSGTLINPQTTSVAVNIILSS